MTNAVAGVGTELQVGDAASPEVFTKIAEILNIDGPQLSVEQVEVTSLDSTGGYKEFIAGLKDGGQVSFPLNWINDTQQTQLRDDVDGGTQRNYRIVWPDSPATQVAFAAIVTEFSMSTEPNAAIQGSVTMKISGQPTWT